MLPRSLFPTLFPAHNSTSKLKFIDQKGIIKEDKEEVIIFLNFLLFFDDFKF